MIGQPVRRVEDERFLTGCGRFIDDLVLPGMLHCAVVRSPYPHARIKGISSSALVFTGQDMERDGVGPMRAGWQVPGMIEPPRWLIMCGNTARADRNVPVRLMS